MNAISPSEVRPAAYCGLSNTLFNYEQRDLFAGELFCPDCTARTEIEHRASTLREMRELYPQATLYEPAPELAEMRPHARR